MKKLFVMTLLMSSSLAFAASDIPVVGINDAGEEFVLETSESNLEKSMTYFHETTKEVASNQLVNESLIGKWTLEKFSLGLTLSGEFGLGPWQLGMGLKQVAIFKK